MTEAAWALGLLILIGAVGAIELMGFASLIELGQALMLRSALIGIPLELVYYALLALAIMRHPECPRGWYWRPFAHHQLLTARQRLWVLPFFYLGALGFLGIVLGIATVLLAFVAAVREA
jgi:hypothetical protein